MDLQSSHAHVSELLVVHFATITSILRFTHSTYARTGIIGAPEPASFVQVLLDLASVVGWAFRDGKRTRPDFASPMTSLTKRQSGHLATLIFRYHKRLRNHELGSTDTSRQDGFLHVEVAEGQPRVDSEARAEMWLVGPALFPPRCDASRSR